MIKRIDKMIIKMNGMIIRITIFIVDTSTVPKEFEYVHAIISIKADELLFDGTFVTVRSK